MAEPCTPKASKQRFSRQPHTPIHIPPSPYMKRLGYGCGVSVLRWDRSPRPNTVVSPWALKKLLPGQKSTIFKERLKSEADILKSLNHPNIVGFRACIPNQNGSIALAMESCESSLGDIIENRRMDGKGPFESSTMLKVALGMARGLDYLHTQKNLLHGDIKSFNVLIKGDFEEVKLCDFGVSCGLNSEGELINKKSIGTSVWNAPENCGLVQAPISSKVDIFAFGLVLWEMITLTLPHTDDLCDSDQDLSISEDELESRIGTRPGLPPIDLDDSYNPLLEMFYCCTEQNPDTRPSASMLVDWLEDIISENALTNSGGTFS